MRFLALFFIYIIKVFCSKDWVKQYNRLKQFIENKGEFDEFSTKDFGNVL
jgi:hypothetical protein